MTITYGAVRAHISSANKDKAEPSRVRLFLEKQSVMSLKPANHQNAVQVWSGKLWITQEGDPKDYVLSAGDTFPLKHSGRVVIQAMEESVLGVSER